VREAEASSGREILSAMAVKDGVFSTEAILHSNHENENSSTAAHEGRS